MELAGLACIADYCRFDCVYYCKNIEFSLRVFFKKENSTTEALKILNERYARDEISEEEYLHRKETLTEDRTR